MTSTLSTLRTLPMSERARALGAPLSALATRSVFWRRVRGLVTAAVIFAAGAALAIYELDPPLSQEEITFIFYGVVLVLLSVVAAAWTFVVPDPALWALTDEDIVWAYRRVVRGGRQYLALSSDRGIEAELRLDEDGVRLDEGVAAAAMQELARLHAGVHLGYTPELAAAYRRDPASLRRGGLARPKTWAHHLYRWRLALVWTLIGGALLVVFIVEPIIRLSMRYG